MRQFIIKKRFTCLVEQMMINERMICIAIAFIRIGGNCYHKTARFQHEEVDQEEFLGEIRCFSLVGILRKVINIIAICMNTI
jgi:hypothetical protein